MKNKHLIILILVLIIPLCIFLEKNNKEKENINVVTKRNFNLLYQECNTNEFIEWKDVDFPGKDKYYFDIVNSFCKDQDDNVIDNILSYVDGEVMVSTIKEVHCSLYFKCDSTPPTCEVIKYDKTPAEAENGVSGKILCSDDISGCETEEIPFENLKETTSYEIKDKIGNAMTCTIAVSSTQQQDKCKTYKSGTDGGVCGTSGCDCYSYSYDCSTSVCINHTESGNCSMYERHPKTCYGYGCRSTCANTCRNAAFGCETWNNNWTDVSNCTADNKSTQCRTIYS